MMHGPPSSSHSSPPVTVPHKSGPLGMTSMAGQHLSPITADANLSSLRHHSLPPFQVYSYPPPAPMNQPHHQQHQQPVPSHPSSIVALPQQHLHYHPHSALGVKGYAAQPSAGAHSIFPVRPTDQTRNVPIPFPTNKQPPSVLHRPGGWNQHSMEATPVPAAPSNPSPILQYQHVLPVAPLAAAPVSVLGGLPLTAPQHITATTPQANEMLIPQKFRTRLCEHFGKETECPFGRSCMFAHGPHQLRTEQKNIEDGLVTAEAVRSFRAIKQASARRRVENRRRNRRNRAALKAANRLQIEGTPMDPSNAAEDNDDSISSGATDSASDDGGAKNMDDAHFSASNVAENLHLPATAFPEPHTLRVEVSTVLPNTSGSVSVVQIDLSQSLVGSFAHADRDGDPLLVPTHERTRTATSPARISSADSSLTESELYRLKQRPDANCIVPVTPSNLHAPHATISPRRSSEPFSRSATNSPFHQKLPPAL